VGRAVGACLSERCVVFGFLQVLSRIPLVVLGDPQGCPRHLVSCGGFKLGSKRFPCWITSHAVG
jgi:hypothetical protein